MDLTTRDALVDSLAGYERVVEIGIGRRYDVAVGLATAGTHVIATDVHRPDDRLDNRSDVHRLAVPSGVQFVVDDVTEPTESVYVDAEAVYALNLPPELHRPTLALARSVGADFLFTTLGHDQPAIPVERRTIPGDTLFLATSRS